MSRLPLLISQNESPIPAETVLLMEHLNSTPLSALRVREWTRQDPVLSQVLRLVQNGWPEHSQVKELQPFAVRSTEMSVQDGCLLWGNRVIIPPQGRQQILNELHNGHPGVARMKSLARMYVWWPKMDEQIEQTVRHCSACQQNRAAPPKAPLHPWEWPNKPWSRLHIDFAGPVQGHMLLVIIDAHSKWIEAFAVRSATTTVVMQCLRTVFARFGLPDTVVSDNGTCFVSAEFRQFLEKNGIRHTTSAPYHPASNGLAERAVQIVKQGLKKMTQRNLIDRLSRLLFSFQSTRLSKIDSKPIETLSYSSSEATQPPAILRGRRCSDPKQAVVWC